jgi:hypothetical protein
VQGNRVLQSDRLWLESVLILETKRTLYCGYLSSLWGGYMSSLQKYWIAGEATWLVHIWSLKRSLETSCDLVLFFDLLLPIKWSCVKFMSKRCASLLKRWTSKKWRHVLILFYFLRETEKWISKKFKPRGVNQPIFYGKNLAKSTINFCKATSICKKT